MDRIQELTDLLISRRRKLVTWAFFRCRNYDLAEDCVQSGSLKAYLAIENFRGEVPMYAWLRTIVRNEIWAHYSAYRQERECELTEWIPDTAPTPFEVVYSRQREELAAAVSKKLTPALRAAVDRRLRGDVISDDGFRLLRAVTKMRKQLRKRGRGIGDGKKSGGDYC